MNVAICIASRGVGHYRTIAGVLREVADVPHSFHFALGLPIPDAQNLCVEQALADPAVTHLWFVEDDHLIPVGALSALLNAHAPVAAIEYLLRSGLSSVMRDAGGTVRLVGLGVTLIERAVFAAIPSPPFQVSTRHTLENGRWIDTGVPEHAGGLDAFFCRQVVQAGLQIAVVPGVQAGHLETVRVGGRDNEGIDEVRCWGGSDDLPWYPKRRDSMAARYLKSASGLVIDIDPELGGDVGFYLNNGWTEIGKREFDSALKAQLKAQEAARLQWIADAEQEGVAPQIGSLDRRASE